MSRVGGVVMRAMRSVSSVFSLRCEEQLSAERRVEEGIRKIQRQRRCYEGQGVL